MKVETQVDLTSSLTFHVPASASHYVEVEKDDDMDDWNDLMYEDSLTATYGSVASAPTVPMSPPPAPAAPVEEAPPAPPVASGAPPIPAEGLPPGWSDEQWNAYGQQYLDGKM